MICPFILNELSLSVLNEKPSFLTKTSRLGITP